jgi:hypothetical protein
MRASLGQIRHRSILKLLLRFTNSFLKAVTITAIIITILTLTVFTSSLQFTVPNGPIREA